MDVANEIFVSILVGTRDNLLQNVLLANQRNGSPLPEVLPVVGREPSSIPRILGVDS